MSSHNYEETGMTTLTLWVKLWVDDIHIQSETEKEWVKKLEIVENASLLET